jgi:hypothetical protein
MGGDLLGIFITELNNGLLLWIWRSQLEKLISVVACQKERNLLHKSITDFTIGLSDRMGGGGGDFKLPKGCRFIKFRRLKGDGGDDEQ